ncbi:MAG: hypothetical protein V2I82_11470 [Halieaceae bacterium]|jgi:hypothetical protein|nr:hypothetical protein [Halieaceae bacterium]
MARIYRVKVGDDDVAIDWLGADGEGYAKAKDRLIHRESLAIECFYDHSASGTLHGNFYFSSLDIARSFALLNLKARQQVVAANMDRILRYASDDADDD